MRRALMLLLRLLLVGVLSVVVMCYVLFAMCCSIDINLSMITLPLV